MATKAVMHKEGQRLVPAGACWADMMEGIPQGVDLNVTVTQARSIPQLGTYWGALDWVIKNGPEWIGDRWLSRDELSDALQMEVGFVRPISHPAMPKGTVYNVPKSKSFSECSQKEFNTYFEAVQTTLVKWCNFDAVEAYLIWMAEREKGAA